MSFDSQNNKKNQIIKIAISFIICLLLISFFVLACQLDKKRSIEITSHNPNPQKNNQEANIFKSLIPSKDRILGNNNLQNKKEINILALGTKGKEYGGEQLTDTIIVAHIEPANKKTILISLPRDLLVKIPKKNQKNKINAIYNTYGIESLKKIAKEITGFHIDHYAIVDLTVAREVIDAVDGLNIYVPHDINDPYFPAPNNNYQTFKMKAGWRYMKGKTALRYIRSRYTSPNGDFDRMARQQQILTLLKQKVLTLNPLKDFSTYFKIFQNLQNHIIIDLNAWQLKDIWQIAKDTPVEQIKNIVIDKKETNLLTENMVKLGKYDASVVYPKKGQGNYEEVKKYIRGKLRN